MAQPPRVRQPFHHDHTHTLTPAGAVRRLSERLAPAVRGQPTLLRETR